MVLAANTKALWYMTRSTGFVTLALLTISVVLGITEATRWSITRWPRFVVAGLHKNVSLLVTAFLAVHIATAIVDGFAPIGWLDAAIPFRSPYRPLWLGLGAVAFDLVVALIITSLLRRHLGYRAWKAVHWAAYACWPVALAHGLGTGSDAHQPWALAVDAVCLAAVAGAVWWRLARTSPATRRRPALLWTLSIVVPAVLVGWAFAGPLRRGWARRAGTPAALVGAPQPVALDSPVTTVPGGSSSTGSSSTGSGAPDQSPLRVPFTADFQGTVKQQPSSDGTTTVAISGNLSGGASAPMVLTLRGPAAPGGGVELQSSDVSIGVSGELQGQIVQLDGGTLVAQLQDGAGSRVVAVVRLQVDSAGERATGTVTARAGGAFGQQGGGGEETGER